MLTVEMVLLAPSTLPSFPVLRLVLVPKQGSVPKVSNGAEAETGDCCHGNTGGTSHGGTGEVPSTKEVLCADSGTGPISTEYGVQC